MANLRRSEYIMKGDEGRIPIVETLRGIAALSVLLHHWTACVPGFIQNSFMFALCDSLNIGVYIFFAISGFIMPYALYRGGYELRHIGKFVLKRIIRLDPPFIASIAFCVFAAYAATLHPSYTGVPFRFDPVNLGLHLCYLCPFFEQPWVQGGIYWTLGIEFQFYILLALVFPVVMARNRLISLTVVGVFTALCVFDGPHYRFKFITPYVPFFSMGILTFLFRIGRLGTLHYLILLTMLCVLAGFKFHIHQMAGGIGASLAIAFYRKSSAPLLFFGMISYSLYLFHFPIAIKTVNYLTRYAWAIRFNWAIVLLGSTLCIIVAWLCYLAVEKPSKKLARSINYGAVDSVLIDQANPANRNSG